MEELKWHHRHPPRRVDGIVEEQVRRWQFRPSDSNRATFWPIVTISRESGSLGLALGRRVAERLGFTFWDQEIVTAVAERLHVDPSKVMAFDEHAPDGLDVILTALRLARGGLANDYRAQLRILFASISHHGAAVIVGRGAHCAVPSSLALKVRLVAPLEKRIADYETTCQTTHEAALREVPAGDKERAEFVRRAFHSDVTDPTQYDVVINVGTYSPVRAESMVLMAYLAKFGQLPAESRDSVAPRHSIVTGVAHSETSADHAHAG
jgi:cytidylate kinase